MMAIAEILVAVSKVNTCIANEACKSALSMLPEGQGIRLEKTMEGVKKHLDFAKAKTAPAGLSEADKQLIVMAKKLAFLVEDVMERYLYHALKLQKEQEEQANHDHDDHVAALRQVVALTAEIEDLVEGLREFIVIAPDDNTRTSQGQSSPVGWSLLSRRIRDMCHRMIPWLVGQQQPIITAADKNMDMVDLINFLTNEYLTDFFSLERSRKVLCIVGSAGRANEIASKLFDYAQEHFGFSVSVPKGKENRILAHVLEQTGKKSTDSNGQDDDDRTLQINQIGQALKLKRYMILINDISEADTWKKIETAFPDNGLSSRIVVTTRRIDVAEECFSGQSDLIFRVRPPPPPPLPAAAVSLPVDERAAEEGDLNNLNTLLSSCSLDLRACCLYLSTVLDGHVFERDNMVRKWFAEGFISQEEVADEHFAEFLNKNVIQPERQHYCRFVEDPTYKVNPKMLCHLRKISREEGFACTITSADEQAPTMIRRLSMHCHYSIPSAATAAASKVPLHKRCWRKTPPTPQVEEHRHIDLCSARSITLRGHGKGVLTDLNEFHLHVLDLEDCANLEDPDVVNICRRMILLKYLSIKGTMVTVLPPDVKNLQNLETLDVRETLVTKLPQEIAELLRLAHLLVNGGLVVNVVNDNHVAARMTTTVQQVPRSHKNLKVAGRCSKFPTSWINHHMLSSTVTLLDIKVCQLEDGDLEALGRMSALRSLVLALVGLPTRQMVITSHESETVLLFEKLEVFTLDCHVPWVTFKEGAMSELRRLCLKLYAGPAELTPSGTNHLKKLHEVTLDYPKDYAKTACVMHTTATMQKEALKRAKPTTFIIDGKVTIPKIEVSGRSRMTLVWSARKSMRLFFDYIFTPLCPPASAFRPLLANMPEWQLVIMIPLVGILFYYIIRVYSTVLLKITPLVFKVASWLARRVLHAAAIFLLYNLAGKSRWTLVVILPAAGYHLFHLAGIAYSVLSTVILLVCTTLFWCACGLVHFVLVYILNPVWYILATLLPKVAPIVCTISLTNHLAAKHKGEFLVLLPVLALLFYFFRTLFCSGISRIPQLVCNVANWLIWGA